MIMPWWAAAYLLLYAGFCCWCGYDDIRTRHRKWIAGDIAFEAGGLLLALSYWWAPLRAHLELVALPLFVGAVVWNVVEAGLGFQKLFFARDLPSRGNLALCLFGLFLAALITAPLLYWGFLVAVLGQTGVMSDL